MPSALPTRANITLRRMIPIGSFLKVDNFQGLHTSDLSQYCVTPWLNTTKIELDGFKALARFQQAEGGCRILEHDIEHDTSHILPSRIPNAPQEYHKCVGRVEG